MYLLVYYFILGCLLLVVGCWWLVVGGWWLVVGGWWLVVGWLLVVGGWLLVVGFIPMHKTQNPVETFRRNVSTRIQSKRNLLYVS
jgi:hypothetical protein